MRPGLPAPFARQSERRLDLPGPWSRIVGSLARLVPSSQCLHTPRPSLCAVLLLRRKDIRMPSIETSESVRRDRE